MKSTRKPNRLINETSPYLQQHAHNPVDWYPWGDEAFAKAKAEDKPVLVSIGYSACHWCHVMEHESFEDWDTAKLMNENFVNIKVDMEERPDIDTIYMTFVQMTSGRGGWPLNVFLTPDKLPFFGGTYFPPDGRWNMPSFQQILTSVAEAYRERRGDVLHTAVDVVGEMRRASIAQPAGDMLSHTQLDFAFESLARSFDATNGGFGGAPKFPAAMSLEFLLRYHKRTGNPVALEMVTKTCTKMAQGGMYDQLGGGFHRYSVDAVWLVPHFEKMLYDNAQLALVYLHVYQVTGDEFYKRITVEILEYIVREMTDPAGGFYSTQDADSEGVEGKFFVWRPEDVIEILGVDDAKAFNYYYDVTEHGNFEESNILNVRHSLKEAADTLSVTTEKLIATLERGREKLFVEREKRIKPFRDEKILTAWNGLMLATFAESAAVLGREDYLNIAVRNAGFVISSLKKDGRLFRTTKDGRAKLNAYVDDYANFADGLIALYQATGEIKWLIEAKELADTLVAEYWDPEDGAFFFTSNDHEELVVRTKDFYDNATPAGNNVAADVLLKLSKFFLDESYQRYAVSILRLVSSQIRKYPQAFGRALSTFEFFLNPVKEIVLVSDLERKLANEVWGKYIPGKILIHSSDEEGSGMLPLQKDKKSIHGKPTAYVCENFTCQKPVTEISDLARELSA